MAIISFSFFVAVLLAIGIFYLIPKRIQWLFLLIYSLIFYYYAANPGTILFPIGTTIVTYFAGSFLDSRKKITDRKKKWILTISLVLNIAVWLVLRNGFLSELSLPISGKISFLTIPALGMGYYTFQAISYIIECYWGNILPEKNVLKVFLYIIYFPQMTTGPISRWEQVSSLYQKHFFNWDNISLGAQRVLWGLAKKIILAERISPIVTGIVSKPNEYTGFYSWFAILLYPIQMYADFSGCMDIVLGISEMFDIRLPENFNNPFFSKTSQEFWQRWHITLGTWAKDYVLFPLLKTKIMVIIGKKLRTIFGKKTGKFITTSIAIAALWFVIGFWHGGVRYILGVSLWYWIILMLESVIEPRIDKYTKTHNINASSFSWHLLKSSITYLIYAIGAVFFHMEIPEALNLLNSAGSALFNKDVSNPWVLFAADFTKFGITNADKNVIIIMVFLLFLVGLFREKYGFARIWVKKQILPFRWLVWISLFIFVLIFGKYGPGYNPADFIYKGF